MPKSEYPRCEELGLTIALSRGVPYIALAELEHVLPADTARGKRFNHLFGVQTVPESGAYPWDVEAVLERMASGKRTGTQLIFD